MELLLIRHGRPHRLERASGPADPTLDDEGLRQAEALARWLAHESIDAVYTSPLRRAAQTAAPLAERLGCTPTVRDGIAEWDRDASRYIPTEELRAAEPDVWKALTGGDWDALGIDLPAFLHRVLVTIDQVTAAHAGQRVAMVCHGGVINAYLARVLHLEQVLFFEPGYTSVSRVLVTRDGRSGLKSINEMGHLHPSAARLAHEGDPGGSHTT